jgi:hypothetical protein
MKLPTTLPTKIVLALFVCVQGLAASPLGAQLVERLDSAVKGPTSRPSSLQNNDAEIRLKPDGINSDPGWALDQIGERFSDGTPVQIYSYPDTTTPVRLYLIDTAVKNPISFLAANSNLKSLEVISLLNNLPVPRDHGTQMLSLIAGTGTGIATGTPIHVVNYDIYADSLTADPSTNMTNLAEAIAEAVMHSRLPDTVPMRSVICIATSSITSGLPSQQRFSVERSIESALAAGIPVILSAGNLGADASSYTPPSNGNKNGVITVGASDVNNLKISSSNYGTRVDVLAPGSAVKSRRGGDPLLDPIIPMTGTSPATALVAGAVLAKLSASPTFTPAGLESSLKAAALVTPSGSRVLRSIVAPTPDQFPPDVVPDGPIIVGATSAALLGFTPSTVASLAPTASSAAAVNPAPLAIDSDSDGFPDIVETFYGSPYGIPPSPVISLDSDRQVQFKFPIDQSLFNSAIIGDVFILRNGYSWQIQCSFDRTDWVIPVGSLSKITDEQGQAWLTASFPAGSQISCDARIEIIAPPTQ